jgi:hypothetical protein
MRPLRARRAKIVPVPALVDRKTGAGLKMDAGLKVDADRKMGVVPKVDVAPKADAVLKTGAVVPDDVRSRAWSSLSVRQFRAARLTQRGSRLQAFRFGRLRLQSPDHVAVLVAKAPMVPVVDQVAPVAARLRVVIANFATRANRGRHTSKFFTSSACFSM